MRHFLLRGDKQNNVRQAFSIPELIVVLGLAAVIAALTIMNFVDKVNQQKNMVMLRKIRTTLTHVTDLLVGNDMSPLYWDIKDYDFRSAQLAYSYYKPYFQVIRECANDKGCWKYPTKYLSGQVYLEETEPYQYMFTLIDGVNILINVFPKEIIRQVYGVNVDAPSVVFIVDLNGDGRPNHVGLDIFAFVLRDEAVVPAGIDSTYNCNAAGYGLTCTARVMENNWKINYNTRNYR